MPFVPVLVMEDIAHKLGGSQGCGEGGSGPWPLCLWPVLRRGKQGSWAWTAGGGSGAVELLRSLERQTESLAASKNNQARVRFPGVSPSGKA